jgi:hypothetical protein
LCGSEWIIFNDPGNIGLTQEPAPLSRLSVFIFTQFESKLSLLQNKNPQLSLRALVPGTGLLHDPPMVVLPKSPRRYRGLVFLFLRNLKASFHCSKIKTPSYR